MRMKRVPDRVHVVHPPQDDHEAGIMPAVRPGPGQGMEIVRTLAQISDKLKRSEAERYELLNEMREYRKALNALEDKAEQSHKVFQAMETQIAAREKVESDISQRQARFEKILKDTEEKIVQAVAGQALVDGRLKDNEERQLMITQRLDESVVEQTRLDRQIEKVAQEKIRMLRKVERLEEITTETQDALRARALVLLTDQSVAAQGLASLPALARSGETMDTIDISGDQPWWRKTMQIQSFGMASMVIAALLAGWMINQAQQQDVPQIAVLENGGLAKLNLSENRWEMMTDSGASAPDEPVSAKVEPASGTAPVETPAVDAAVIAAPTPVQEMEDAELLKALDENPDALAAQLNDIAPEARDALDVPAAPAPADKITQTNQTAMDEKAFAQKPSVVESIKADKPSGALSDRITPDDGLPKIIKAIEATAYDGKAEAQHDLAAIYTAGQQGVTQNFERAALWFREAADNGVSNAMYNMGVLHHQGLGVSKDMDRALYWYREAAKLNHPEAQYNLGIAYIEGIGADYDPATAAVFFERAAGGGVMEAAYNLGLIHENGLLGEANPNEALLWYKIAADQGSPDAKSALAQMIRTLQIGEEDVGKIVERMQATRAARDGRRAGPDKTSSVAPAPAPQPAPADPLQLLTAQVQEQLKSMGLYSGIADGVIGPNTVQAIQTYQTKNGLEPDGKPTDGLLSHMLFVQ